MSSIPPATTEPNAPANTATVDTRAPVETAPSATITDPATLARIFGFIGLFLFVLGGVVILTTRLLGPRWVPEGVGFLSAAFGLVLMLYHAVADSDQEVRRMYGGLSVAFLMLSFASAVLPGPFNSASEKTVGFYLLPWGVCSGLVSLLFMMPFIRHETDEFIRKLVINGLLAVGTFLCVGVLAYGAFFPAWLAGTGLALAVLGLAFVCAYLGQVDTDDGIGFTVAFTLGAVGAGAIFYAFARAVFPTVLFDGQAILRDASQKLDTWKLAGRLLVIGFFAGVIALGALGKYATWLRGTLAVVGLVCAGVFVAASMSTPVTTPPKPFLVPGGLIIGAIGLAYLCVALGVCSDSQIVVLTRRELASYFLSPLGYLVIGAVAVAQWFGYWEFINRLDRMSAGGRGAVPEPIVRFYIVALIPILALKIQVAAITMRLFAEEKRTGTLEVLFTAPVNEWGAVVSKFLSTWLFFMICWIPSGLFLIVLKMEGGANFDYRPLLGFYVALGATGAAFVAMGLYSSALSNNQIVSAALTFLGMLGFLVCYFVADRNIGLSQTLQLFLTKFSYIDLWATSLSGQLPVRDVLLWVSLAVFFLFVSVKTLEIRRWS